MVFDQDIKNKIELACAETSKLLSDKFNLNLDIALLSPLTLRELMPGKRVVL